MSDMNERLKEPSSVTAATPTTTATSTISSANDLLSEINNKFRNGESMNPFRMISKLANSLPKKNNQTQQQQQPKPPATVFADTGVRPDSQPHEIFPSADLYFKSTLLSRTTIFNKIRQDIEKMPHFQICYRMAPLWIRRSSCRKSCPSCASM